MSIHILGAQFGTTRGMVEIGLNNRGSPFLSRSSPGFLSKSRSLFPKRSKTWRRPIPMMRCSGSIRPGRAARKIPGRPDGHPDPAAAMKAMQPEKREMKRIVPAVVAALLAFGQPECPAGITAQRVRQQRKTRGRRHLPVPAAGSILRAAQHCPGADVKHPPFAVSCLQKQGYCSSRRNASL